MREFVKYQHEVDDVEGLAAAATKHLELLKQKDKANYSVQLSSS